jgi:hypothetical protein
MKKSNDQCSLSWAHWLWNEVVLNRKRVVLSMKWSSYYGEL